MSEKTRDAFSVALIALLILVGALMIVDFTADNIGALAALIFGMLLVALIHAITWYKLRRAEIEADTQVALNAYIRPPEERIITYNSPRTRIVSDKIIELTSELSLDRQKLTDFIVQSMEEDGPGLAISRWKAMGWEQELLEKLLDYMYEIGFITQRKNGTACVYVDDFTPGKVIRELESRAIVR